MLVVRDLKRIDLFFAFVRKVFRLQEIILAVAAKCSSLGEVKCWLGASVSSVGWVPVFVVGEGQVLVGCQCSSLGKVMATIPPV